MAQTGFGGAFGLPPEDRKWFRSEEKFWGRLQSQEAPQREKFWLFLMLVLFLLFALTRFTGGVFT